MMGKRPHLVLLPFPAQGHVSPMMKLAYKLVNHGIKITFVSTETLHAKIMSSLPQDLSLLSFASIPEFEFEKTEKVSRIMQNFIDNLNKDDEQVSHVIADVTLGWALTLANNMGIKPVAFAPYSLGSLALVLHIPMLFQAGIIDEYGIPIKEEIISLSADIPSFQPSNLIWNSPVDVQVQKVYFKSLVGDVAEYVKVCDEILANSFEQLETSACNLIPKILPIGPLSVSDDSRPFAGNIWAESSTCLTWLDQQPAGSVIYVAFGSSVFCDREQLNELAMGLEMTKRPFLWVVRADFTSAKFPDGFTERVASYGKIVEWAPQEKVLAHPSTAIFFSHCGWNSTMEGLSFGVPFLCWPYGMDQFHNRDNICGTWKIGLELIPDEKGIVTSHQIKSKIESLISDQHIKANSLKFKEIAKNSVSEGGSSFKNFISFIDQLKL